MYNLTVTFDLFQFDDKRKNNTKNKKAAPDIMQNHQRAIQSRLLFSVGITLFILMSRASSATLFTTADFEGTWYMHALGVKENSGGWGYGTYIFDSNGSCTGSYITSTGHSESPSGTLSIDGDGIIKALNLGGLTSTFHGVMNNKKDMMFSTGTGGDGSFQLLIFTKSAEAIATSDLQGTWMYHGLIAGNEPYQEARWWYGSMTIDESGNAVPDSPITDSKGIHEITTDDPLELIVTEGGIITELDPEIAPMHGAINQSKDMIVLVDTVVEKSSMDTPGNSLLVLVKQAPGAYTAYDLAGTWYLHELACGSSYDDWIGWCYDTLFFDSRGNGNSVAGSYLDCSGETDHTWGGTMDITSDGIITLSNMPIFQFHGIMNLGKDMWIGTMNDSGGGYGLLIAAGRPADEFNLADFNNDGIINADDFAFLVADWGKTNVDSVADISGPDGIPDRNVDDYDLRAFCEQMFGVILPPLPLES